MGKLGKATAEQIADGIDLTGRIALITGATGGIGRETARIFAKQGAHVVLACRDEVRTTAVIRDLTEITGNKNIDFLHLDLLRLDSVRSCAAQFLKSYEKLDILVLNAGVMMCPETITSDGFEMQFQTNHLSHFLLTMLLLPAVVKVPDSRIVAVSSLAHTFVHNAEIELKALSESPEKRGSFGRKALSFVPMFRRTYLYAQSKLCNVLFAKHLSKLLKEKGYTTVVNSLHPGVISTDLGRHLALFDKMKPVTKVFMKDIPRGAATSVYAAIHPDVAGKSGRYFSDCAEHECSAVARSESLAEWLWNYSIAATKVTPTI